LFVFGAEGEIYMKNALISAFAFCLALAAPTALWAADDHHPGPPGGGGHPGGAPAVHNTMMPRHAPIMHHTFHNTYHHTTHFQNHVVNRTNVHVNVDINSYHKNFDAPQHYHFGVYNAPPGYVYRRWTFGEQLPSIYFAQQFWITNYLNFGLVAPPGGYEWVRYGPDALLIDVNTGQIIQVEYGLFY
jgi:Ni/Co efflux regulator RcnB